MLKYLLVLCAALAAVLSMPYSEGVVSLPFDAELSPAWQQWKDYHGWQYQETEEAFRRDIWEDNLKYIRTHNLDHSLGKHTYTMEMNKYGAMKNNEFRAMLNGYKMRTNSTTMYSASMFLSPSNILLPDSVDWRTKGYVSEVKDQGQCGSCWSFSATGSLEGQSFKKTGTLPDLSEQNLVDCSTTQGNSGCNGGLMDQAFQYVKVNNGIDSEESYPYEGVDGKCRFKASTVAAKCTGFTDVQSGSESSLQQALASVGPVSVAIDASHQSFQFYATGVYDEPACSSSELDHGVLAVGYGTKAGADFWIVKNSWAATWGEKGYINMARNKNNQCGIATQASYPLV